MVLAVVAASCCLGWLNLALPWSWHELHRHVVDFRTMVQTFLFREH